MPSSSKWLREKSGDIRKSPLRRRGPNASGADGAPAFAGATASDVERLSATATVLLVGVVELEALVQALAHEVELRAVEVGEAFRVDQHLDPVALERLVLGGDLVGELELVREARAARRAHAQAQAHALAALLDIALHVLRGAIGEGHGHGQSAACSWGWATVDSPAG